MSTIKKEGTKVYIEGVRKIPWDTGEMCEFASALVSAMQCLGECIPYHYMMGTSGAAFRFTLNPGEWDFGNYGIRNISTDPYEPIRRAIEATGYEYTLCQKAFEQEDTAAIMASIAKGIPVLAFGVVGPSDCCIISGYDEGGEVLLGWSTYRDATGGRSTGKDAAALPLCVAALLGWPGAHRTGLRDADAGHRRGRAEANRRGAGVALSLECDFDLEARCFVPVSETYEEIISKRQIERERVTDPLLAFSSEQKLRDRR